MTTIDPPQSAKLAKANGIFADFTLREKDRSTQSGTETMFCCYFDLKPSTLWWTNILLWKITIFHGKIHYFYGHFPLLFVCSPKGKNSCSKILTPSFLAEMTKILQTTQAFNAGVFGDKNRRPDVWTGFQAIKCFTKRVIGVISEVFLPSIFRWRWCFWPAFIDHLLSWSECP